MNARWHCQYTVMDGSGEHVTTREITLEAPDELVARQKVVKLAWDQDPAVDERIDPSVLIRWVRKIPEGPDF